MKGQRGGGGASFPEPRLDHQGLEEDCVNKEEVSRERRKLRVCHLTRAGEIRALQAVPAGGGEAALGEAALAAGQHSCWGYNTRWGLLPKSAVQVLNFLFL